MRIDKDRLPRHIAIIMDGNGRWAKRRGLPRIFGHRAGVTSVREAVRVCGELEIEVLTLFAFSSENWSRPQTEVAALMGLLKRYLRKEIPELNKNHVRLLTIGDLRALPAFARKELQWAKRQTAKNRGLKLVLALSYGGRQEILRAVNRLMKNGRSHITLSEIGEHLDTRGLPDPDLLIRTSGEMRLSNFLLWQTAYAEIYVTDTLWPDFRKADLYRAIFDFQRRQRRFGTVGVQ